MLRQGLLFLVVAVGVSQSLAASISLTPDSRVPPIVPITLHVAVGSASEAGERYIDWGVDFTFGQKEAIVSDPTKLLFMGVNADGKADFREPIDGRIVDLGTTQIAETNDITVLLATVINTLFEVFDRNGNLLESVVGGATANSSWTHQITRPSYGIAYFRVSQAFNTNFGFQVARIFVETPIAVPVPEPTSLSLDFILFLAAGVRSTGPRP